MDFNLFSKMRFEGSRVLITGASKGLGAYCAQSLAGLGAKLLLVARTVDSLEKIRSSCKNSDIHKILAADLTDPVASAEKVAHEISLLGGIDIVIHAAGGGFGLKDPLLGYQD
ncbi:MAG: SDR family NAD(P)-dependent oxidoreductase, partial [Chlamydiae bacterium]|nr:SDR family NAD(P)-dependent oxidoreductase [Chlamydiota bacterium]